MPKDPPGLPPPTPFNIADLFLDQRIHEGRGRRVALRHDGGESTYLEVWRRANRYARVLESRGVRPDDRVMIAMSDGPEFVAALFGTLKLGAVGVMINPGQKAADVAGLLAYTRCRCAVVDDAVAGTFAAAVAREPDARRYLAATLTAGELEGLGGELDGTFETFPTHPDDPALWLFSGGTTGRPKAVVQTHRSFANTTELYARKTLGYREDDVTLSVPKLYFGYATGSNLFFPFAAGATAVLFREHPTVEVVFEQIARHRPTILINVPTLIHRMVSHPDAPRQDLSCLRFVTSAGEALPEPLYERWRRTFGVELLDGLGTAEMWHVFVTNRPGEVRPGTLGRVVDGFELKVCDDAGRELPDGEVGRLWVRGDSRALGYWQNAGRTAGAFRGEWFVGGDLVCRDADGYVRYCGRSDDVLKVAGKWLVPQEVEACLLRHPAVKECAVVGAEDADGLVKPYAFVVPRTSEPGLARTLQELALAELDAYKHPRRVILLEDLPRTHLGKVDRGKLKQQVDAS